MRRPAAGAVWFPLAVGLLASGCAATRQPRAAAAPAVLPSAVELHAALQARRDAVSSLRALAHVRYRSPDESNSSRQALIVSRPDRLRVEVLSVFGSAFVLTVDDGTITAYVPREATVYRGPASAENLWRYTRLDIGISDLVDIVLGTPPAVTAQHAAVDFDAAAGWIRLSQDDADGSQVVWFSPPAVPQAVERRDRSGQVLWRATFVNYEDHDGVAIATHIGVEVPAWQRSMEVALEDLDVNPALDHSIFALHVPPGSKVVQLDSVVD